MKKVVQTVPFFLLALMITGILHAQQTGEIRGVVIDDAKSPLPGAAITAKGPGLQGLRTSVTDEKGQFRLPLLPIGQYSLLIELPGFEKLTLTGNEVRLGFTANISVVLKSAAISEELTVTAPNPLIDKTTADNSYRLKGTDIANIPAQGRTIEEIVSYTPGVTGVRANSIWGTGTGLPSFRGEGEEGNNWLVDGLSNKGVTYNEPGIRVNYDAWDEVEIISDGFEPGLGQARGGFINIVTKSGGNEFHGEVGALVRDWHLRAKRQDQLSVGTVPDTSLNQFFGNLGGPVIRDKLWFFLSNNYFMTRDATAEQTISWLTIPAGLRRVNTDNTFGKLTFTPLKNHTFSLSGTLDKFLKQTGGIGIPETYDKKAYVNHYYRLNYRGILSDKTLLTGAWGQYRNKWDSGPLNGDFGPPSYFWMDVAQTTNNAYMRYESLERRTDLALNLTHYLDLGRWGSHEFGAGLLYYRNYTGSNFTWTGRSMDPWPGNGFDNGTWFVWESPGVPFFMDEYGPGDSNNSTHGYGFYLEDKAALGRFSFMLGLRADTQTVLNDIGGKIWSWGLGDFLSPRVSASWDLFGDGKNVLKFGFGRFTDTQNAGNLSFFNTKFQFSAREYNWIGESDPTEAQLKDPANWEFALEQSAETMAAEIDPKLKPNTATRYLLEFDRELFTGWVLKARGIISRARNMTDDILVYDPELESKVKYFYTNFGLKRRDYRALEVELNGRVSGRFFLNTSWTWSQAKGTNPGQFELWTNTSGGWGQAADGSAFGNHPDVPAGSPDKAFLDELYQGLGGTGAGDEGWYGFLPYSVDHLVKILAVYQAPLGFNIAAGFEYLSGYHWEKKGWSPWANAFATFPEGRGARMTPAHAYLDLSVEKEIRFRRGMALGLGVNLYNLMNSQRPVSLVNEDTELFGQVWGRQLPRWGQIKFSLRF